MNLEIFDEKLNFIFDNQRQIIIIDKQNGPHSKKLYESVLDYITLNPNSYKGYEKILEDAYQYNDRNYDLYSELFGKFDNDARFLTENIFSQPNIWYYTYINAGLEKFVGKDEKDKLFKNSIFEGLRTNSSIFLLFFSDFLQASGINFEKYFYYNKIPIGSISDLNFVTPFNAGKCASQNLSRKKFEEYKSSHEYWNKNQFFEKVVIYTNYLNDFIRTYLGIIFFISAFFLITNKNFKVFLPLSLYPFSYDLILALTVGPNIDTKYEVITFSLKYLLFSFFLIYLIKFFKDLFFFKTKKF